MTKWLRLGSKVKIYAPSQRGGQPRGLAVSQRWTRGINLIDGYTDLSTNRSFAWTANSSNSKKKILAGDDAHEKKKIKKLSITL